MGKMGEWGNLTAEVGELVLVGGARDQLLVSWIVVGGREEGLMGAWRGVEGD